MQPTERSRASLPPLALAIDVVGVIFLIIALHDLWQPSIEALMPLAFQFAGYPGVLLVVSLALLTITARSVVQSFRGVGLVFADDQS